MQITRVDSWSGILLTVHICQIYHLRHKQYGSFLIEMVLTIT